MFQISLPNGKTFTAEDKETLLDAGLRAGVSLPYSCRTGRCSTCRCRVSGGSTVALHDETGLTSPEKDAGWILSCVRSAISDITMDVEDLAEFGLSDARTLACRIQTIDLLAANVMRVMLRLPPNAALEYRPGQYIDVIGPGGIRRSYSVANAVAEDKCIELHIRQVPDGQMSRFWFRDAKANDLLRLRGPLGTFFLRNVADKDLVFLATGTGIAPVKAMLEALPDAPSSQSPRSTTVYWGGRVPSDLYWDPEIHVARGVRFVKVLSRASDDWADAHGYVQNAFADDAPDLTRSVVYACGSDDMIHDARRQLIGAGLPERQFHSDAFVCSAAF